jgi:predicted nucleotidyltransferase
MQQTINQKIINKTIDRLVETYHPEKIYLFGSYAWGEPKQNSDLDIIIIVKESKEKSYKRSIKGYQALKGLKIAKDIIVYTEDEFEERAEKPGTLCHRIVQEGQLLYESTQRVAG